MSVPLRAAEEARRALEEQLDRRIGELLAEHFHVRGDQRLDVPPGDDLDGADAPSDLRLARGLLQVDRAVVARRNALERTESPYRVPGDRH